MNKKYLSVLLFGAMIATTAGTFTSCKDYDDDIDGLRTEINDNATAAASELASKVTELKNQITSLESAKDKLSTELAAAKQEAATAAANALSAAQKAQAAADAAQKGGDEAKAAAAAAQQTADQATKDLASAVARVATLETKVASLESAVADLKKADSEFSSRLTVLENSIKLNQEAIATNKNGIAENKQAIADANAAILAKATELNSAINDLSVKVGAQIDVINAELNTIKSNYATKDELNSKYQELAAMDAQLKNQIETNANYISALQATVKDLAAKDAELASKIESNYNAVIEKLNATNTELTAASKKIEAIENTVNSLSSQYSALQSAKADLTYVDNINNQLTTLINSLQSTLNDLSTSNASQDRTIGELLTSVKNLQEKTQDLQNQVDKNDAAQTAALQSAVAQLQKEIADAVKAAQDELTVAVEDVKSLAESNKDEIETIKTDLAKKAEQSALDALAADLVENYATVAGVNAEIATVQSDLAEQKSELEGKIAAAETAAKEYADEIVRALSEKVDLNKDDIQANKNDIKALQDFMTDLTNISGEDLSSFVTDNKMSTAISDALEEYYIGISQDFMGQTEFTEWVRTKLRGEILTKYVTNDALSQTLAGYVEKETYNKEIAELNKKISNDDEENPGFEQRIKKLESYLEDLGLVNKSISKRLTSITLVPEHFIDGIEAIQFKTLVYTPKIGNDKKEYRLTNDSTKAIYRMNPNSLDIDCIDKDKVSYMVNTATTRASVENSPIKVTKCNVNKDGEFVVNIQKTDDYKHVNIGDKDSDGKIFIAALRVPINKEFWTVENEDAVVYSEYSRLDEVEFTPELAKSTNLKHHLWDWESAKKENVAYKELAYDIDGYNLMELVKVCENNNTHDNFADYKTYGLKIKFEVEGTYHLGDNKTDEQKFAYMINDTLIASCVYQEDKQFLKNPAAVGRQPIVHVMLLDTVHGNNVVDHKYFKIKWTKTTPIDLGNISSDNNPYCCGDFSSELGVQDMNQKIYAKVPNKEAAGGFGIASATFHLIYPDDNLKVINDETVKSVGEVEVVKDESINTGVASYKLVWKISQQEFHDAVSSLNEDKTLTVNCVWEAADGRGDIKFNMTKTVKAPSFSVGHYNYQWLENHTQYNMNPIVYGTDKQKEEATINSDLLDLFKINNQKPSSILDVVSSSNFNGTISEAEVIFDIEECKKQASNWGVSANQVSLDNEGKTLRINNEVAARIIDNNVVMEEVGTSGVNPTYGTQWYGQAGKSFPTAAAKRVVGTKLPLKVLVNPCGDTNGYTYTAKQFSANVLEPFNVKPNLTDEAFDETQLGGSRVSVKNGLRMEDWNGYLVANVSDGSVSGAHNDKTQTLWKYYGVEKVEWDVEHATTNLVWKNGALTVGNTTGGPLPDKSALSYDAATDELVYKNNGILVNRDFVIYCPVTVTHKWGVTPKQSIAITVKAKVVNN